ncbi:Pleckstrin homology domain-containing protein [Fennellomyces sp. T-0311]|nr:Pleckstrin homology domain-containing protein [Fennellomyces sp. T-0311]
MSRSAFVRNTMNAARAQYERTIEENDDELLREEHRTSNVTFRSVDSHSYDLKRTPSCKSSASNGSLGRFYSTAASSLDMTPAAVIHGNHPTGSKGWQSEVEAILREMYISIRNRQIRHPASKDDVERQDNQPRHSRRRSLQITGSRVGAFKRSVGTIMWKAAPSVQTSTSFPRRRSMSSLKSSFSQSSHLTQSNSITTYQAVAPLLHHSELPTSYTSAAPYYKEGLLVRKHLLVKANQKAKHRDWKECFLVVDRGEIRMYKLDNSGTSENRKSMVRSSIMISRVNLADALANNPSAAVGGGDWLANAESIGEIDLKHTLSNALPSGYSRQRPHAFALQQPNGGVFLFQVGSADQVVEWVSTCNYWAARESKEPLMGGVSNMEYGWGSCLDCVELDENDEAVSWQQNTFPVVTIHEWQPPVPPSVNSAMEEAAQLDVLHKHVQKLNEELDKHRDVKRKMELRVCFFFNFYFFAVRILTGVNSFRHEVQ